MKLLHYQAAASARGPFGHDHVVIKFSALSRRERAAEATVFADAG
jgi:hypothetical protein